VKKTALLAVVVALAFLMVPGKASSHREAPLISQDPLADNTDVYAFMSADAPGMVNIIANYIPLEQPAGGPNFAAFDDNVLYQIHVDNDGDGRDNLTFQYRFHTQTRNPDTFLYNTGPIDSLDDTDWNRPQTYDISLVVHFNGFQFPFALGTNLPTPPVNIGPRSTPNYDALAAAAVKCFPSNCGFGSIKTFAGQRDDPFFVDLGSVFDLAGLRQFNSLHAIFPCLLNACPDEAGHDGVANFNTHTIALQFPAVFLSKPGKPTIGVYASASRQQMRMLNNDGTESHSGEWIQVSRLGQPLINEVVIPIGQKDQWNRYAPENDSQFESLYLSPEVTKLENLLYAALDDANTTNRTDLVAILLTGVPGLNFTGNTRSDMLRLNTSIAATAGVGAGNRLGVLAGDLAGYPNGRRLEDDIVDIDLRAFAEGYGTFLNGLLGLPNRSPNNLLGDGVDVNDKAFLSSFPYLPAPHQGYQVP
jgi:hypothetical protein